MTVCQPADPAGVQEPRCTDGYERLRLQAVEPAGGADRCGLAMLMRQGVAAWLRNLAELCPTPVTPQSATAPLAQEAEMIDILLAIASQHLKESPPCTTPIAR